MAGRVSAPASAPTVSQPLQPSPPGCPRRLLSPCALGMAAKLGSRLPGPEWSGSSIRGVSRVCLLHTPFPFLPLPSLAMRSPQVATSLGSSIPSFGTAEGTLVTYRRSHAVPPCAAGGLSLLPALGLCRDWGGQSRPPHLPRWLLFFPFTFSLNLRAWAKLGCRQASSLPLLHQPRAFLETSSGHPDSPSPQLPGAPIELQGSYSPSAGLQAAHPIPGGSVSLQLSPTMKVASHSLGCIDSRLSLAQPFTPPCSSLLQGLALGENPVSPGHTS
jgi:hypothetical protein